jgi:hypothetical protein
MEALKRCLAQNVAKFNQLTKGEREQKTMNEDLIDPEKGTSQAEAYARYVRKGHYNSMLTGLCELCKAVTSSSDSVLVLNHKLFRNYSSWLQANLVYINANRRQAANLLTNLDFCQWQRGFVGGVEHYKDVTLDRISTFGPDHVFHMRIMSKKAKLAKPLTLTYLVIL